MPSMKHNFSELPENTNHLDGFRMRGGRRWSSNSLFVIKELLDFISKKFSELEDIPTQEELVKEEIYCNIFLIAL